MLPNYASPIERIWFWTFRILCVSVLIFLVSPLLVIIPLSFSDNTFLLYPIENFSLRWYQEFFGNEVWLNSLKNSFIVAPAATLLAMLTHTNVRTPRWLGWFVERPEMHSWHHARGLHRQNYSELPVFDLLFGTFHNPREFASQTGFHEGGSARVIEMMMGRDIARDPVS